MPALILYINMNSSAPVLNSSVSPNLTQAPQAEGIDYVLEPEISKIFRYVLYSIIFVLALGGNIMVCILPFRHRRMRSFTYCLITNLAVSDVGAMLCLPYILITEWNGNNWLMGEVMCKLVNPSMTMFFVVTTNTLAAIALDRFVALVFPFRQRPGKSSSALVIILIWLVAFLCVLPSFGSRVIIPYQDDATRVSCSEWFPSNSEETSMLYLKIYTLFMYLINNLIPVLLIIVLYIIITIHLKRLKFWSWKSIAKRSSSKEHRRKKSTTDVFSAKTKEARESKFTRMLAVVVLIFVICYVPYQTFFLIAILKVEVVLSWRYVYIGYRYLFLLMWLPNALNPICYGSMDQQYARAFKAILRCTTKSQRYLRDRLGSISLSHPLVQRKGTLFQRTENTETSNSGAALPQLK